MLTHAGVWGGIKFRKNPLWQNIYACFLQHTEILTYTFYSTEAIPML